MESKWFYFAGPFVQDDIPLYAAVKSGNLPAVEGALKAGANVNGHSSQPYAPIAVATNENLAGIVDLLLHKGADPNKPINLEVYLPGGGSDKPILDARALNIAILRGNVDIVRLLLKCSRTDPNVTDNERRSLLMAACSWQSVNVEVVRLLLEAGADPALSDEKGVIPLHMVAQNSNTHVVDMLHSRAPATVNLCGPKGATPLFAACSRGHESMVSKLLELGAMQPEPSADCKWCPLAIAVDKGFVGVIRVLINEGGIRAVGGSTVLPEALYTAIRHRRARILQLLLTVVRKNGRSGWANIDTIGVNLLHYGAGLCYPAAVSILLEAGADEAARDCRGRIARETVGLYLGQVVRIDSGKYRHTQDAAARACVSSSSVGVVIW